MFASLNKIVEIRELVVKLGENPSRWIYAIVLSVSFVYLASILAAPLLAMQGEETVSGAVYSFHTQMCHQITARSLCFFEESGSLWVGDCVPQGSNWLEFDRAAAKGLAITGRYEVVLNGVHGFQIANCTRDLGIFAAFFVATLVFPFLKKLDDENIPPKWILFAALVPVGLDGLTQLVGLRQSTNTLRMLTGAIAGIVLPFYIIPMLNAVAKNVFEKLKPSR